MDNAGLIRLSVFLSLLILFMAWEIISPRRTLSLLRLDRWTTNLSLSILNTLVIKLIQPASAIAVGLWAADNSWGLFNQLTVPFIIQIISSLILFDCIIYWQHRLFHVTPLFWRMHRVHHMDMDFDVTTALRFHPLEILASMLIKCAAVAIIGAPVLAILIFEVILNGVSMFNHSNINIPVSLDTLIRKVIVTPDMHRIHHSIHPAETNSNYGFNLSIWDKIFRSYCHTPKDSQESMTIGLKEYQDPSISSKLLALLKAPF